MNSITAGAISGAFATAPMTAVMSYLHRRLPKIEQHSLPPRKITMKIANKAGVKRSLKEKDKFLLTMVNHFSYGAGVGALYFPLTNFMKIPRIASGMIFGLGVWSVSYLGWLPFTGLYKTFKDAPERTLLMISAHLVWGAYLGMVADNLCRRQKLAGFNDKRSLQ